MNCYIKYLIPNKFKRYSILLLVTLLLVCCSKEEDPVYPFEHNNRIQIKASIIGTRSITDENFLSTFKEDDAIGIFIVQDGSQLASTGNYANNSKWIYKSGGWVHASDEDPLYYPDNGKSITVFAYYPYKEGINPLDIEIIVDADQSGDSNEQNDFMTSTPVQVSKQINNPAINLYFTHRLSLVQVQVKGEGEGAELNEKLLQVKLLNCFSQVKFNLRESNSTSLTGTLTEISMKKIKDEYTYRAWVPAQTMADGNNIFSFTQRKSSFYYKKTGTEFLSNHASVFEITLDAKLEADHIYSIGDVYPYKGFPLGVVYEIDGTIKKGKIVSFDEITLAWSNEINNTIITTSDNDEENINIIIGDGIEKYPAFQWCYNYGNYWYLPCKDELELMMNNQNDFIDINNTLSTYSSSINGKYWSSSSHTTFKTSAIFMDTDNYTGVNRSLKTNELKVRPIRRFPKQ